MTIYKSLKSLVLMIAVLSAVPTSAAASALSQMRVLLQGERPEKLSQETVRKGEDVKEEEGEPEAAKGCGPDTVLPVDVCEISQGYLCLNTPPFSAAGEFVVVRGTVDRRTSAFSHLRAYRQHEYTKAFAEVKPASWAAKDCFDDGWIATDDACLDSKGFFGIKVPMAELGPYTIMIDAVNIGGEAVSKTVRTSRVAAPEFARKDIVITPDPAPGVIKASKVQMTVDLLHDCQFCDFIGTSTGGVMITVTNLIESPSAPAESNKKIVIRKSNISSGGKYQICVPVISGQNHLTVSACNAATTGQCPTVAVAAFEVADNDFGIHLLSPPEGQFLYDAKMISKIPLEFSVDGDKTGACRKGEVTLQWNKGEPVPLCPESDGHYRASLMPIVGINVGTIEVNRGEQRQSESFIVGYGYLAHPYTDPESAWVSSGINITLGDGLLNDTVRPLVNDFLNSGDFIPFIMDLVAPKPVEETTEASKRAELKKTKIAEIKNEIPYCQDSSTSPEVKIELVGEPTLKKGEIERFDFSDSGLGFKLDLQGFETHLKAYKDGNRDGRPDASILPLLLSFQGVTIDGRVKFLPEGKPLFLLGSDHDWCDFMSRAYCEEKPALLIPKNIAGGATKSGHFVRCDDEGQEMNEEVRSACRSLNVVNAMTGSLSLQVLKIVNDLLYCTGSAELTYLLRERLRDVTWPSSTAGVESPPPRWMRGLKLEGGIDAVKSIVKMGESGIGAVIPARFGGTKMSDHLDPAARGDNRGVLLKGTSSQTLDIFSDAVSLSLSLDLVNELLFQLVFQPDGMLDWEIDPLFLEDKGLDFTQMCDANAASAASSPFCSLRPRVAELLGTDLSTTGYFSAKQPLRISLKGSRNLAPHLRLYQADIPVTEDNSGKKGAVPSLKKADLLEVQIPDLEMAFYALELDPKEIPDPYGNPPFLVDADGEVVLHSMIEGSEVPVPIIKVRTTLILALEVGNLATLENDPSKLALTLRPVPELTHIIVKRVKGGNATTIPDESILAQLVSKLKFGIEIYNDPAKAIRIKIPKTISLDALDRLGPPLDLFSKIGLEKLTFGKNGLLLSLDHERDQIGITATPQLR